MIFSGVTEMDVTCCGYSHPCGDALFERQAQVCLINIIRTPFSSHVSTENDSFTKTGLGKTMGKLKKKGRVHYSQVYGDVLEACLNNTGCTGFETWGFVRRALLWLHSGCTLIATTANCIRISQILI